MATLRGLAFAASQEAITHLQDALHIQPDYVEAMGLELVDLGKWDEAGTQFSKPVRRLPNFAAAHNNWANILGAEGRLDEAAAEYSEALRIHWITLTPSQSPRFF